MIDYLKKLIEKIRSGMLHDMAREWKWMGRYILRYKKSDCPKQGAAPC